MGSMSMILRYREPSSGAIRIRMAESFALMRSIGWGDDTWRPAPKSMDAQDYLALLNNMAGNAWSCFQFAPLHMAMVSTIGHFIKSADDQCPATGG